MSELHGLKNITLKMYDAEAGDTGFHTKGYIFKKEEIYHIIIGSSNMTSSALTCNKEWNTKLISTGQEAIPSIEKYKLQPNDMQGGFVRNLRKILKSGEERALLISATGTGKTYASAFAMRELGFKP